MLSHDNEQAVMGRIIAHIDLDCFYVQVERSLNPELLNKPVAVVQYNPFGDLKPLDAKENRIVKSGSIIAVSYEARAKGVKRIMRGQEAKKVCPEMILIQVPTSNGKANLDIYRNASADILRVLGSRYPSSVVIERASIDEVYIDVTVEATRLINDSDLRTFIDDFISEVRSAPSLIAGDDSAEVKMTKADIRNGHSGQGIDSILPSSHRQSDEYLDSTEENVSIGWFDRPTSMWSAEDRLLLAGAAITKQLRSDVFNQLGFTCSAGIASNKMLAKLASGMHKPNKQTLVPKSVVSELLGGLPFSRVQGFGGKFGAELSAYLGEKITTMGQLLLVPKDQFIQKFGEETATWILQRANGIDLDPVQDRSLPISIGCSKSFRNANMLTPAHILDGTVLLWLQELAKEVTSRMDSDTERNHRRAKQLHIGVSVFVFNQSSDKQKQQNKSINADVQSRVAEWHEEQGVSLSKTCRLPQGGPSAIAKVAFALAQRAIAESVKIQSELAKGKDRSWGITSLGLSANQFETVVTGKNSIFSYLQSKPLPVSPSLPSQIPSIPLVDLDNTCADFVDSPSKEIQTIELDDFDASLPLSAVPRPNEIDLVLEDDCFSEDMMMISDVAGDGENSLDSIVSKKFTHLQGITERRDTKTTQENSPLQRKAGAMNKDKDGQGSNLPAALQTYAKYLKGIDLEAFAALPSDMQQEILNDCMFNPTAAASNSGSKSAASQSQTKVNSCKASNKRKADNASGSLDLKNWFGSTKK